MVEAIRPLAEKIYGVFCEVDREHFGYVHVTPFGDLDEDLQRGFLDISTTILKEFPRGD